MSKLNVSDAVIQEKLYIASNFAKYSNNTKEGFYNNQFFGGADQQAVVTTSNENVVIDRVDLEKMTIS
ncbi:hypothetical protein [Segatella bryantii]|uniref:hypothetical protein n=1 Tax=Segatella bryantii TaxID=77095 RepID=UPI00242B9D8F|nr:hypothetical protein [Segatella bryantii]